MTSALPSPMRKNVSRYYAHDQRASDLMRTLAASRLLFRCVVILIRVAAPFETKSVGLAQASVLVFFFVAVWGGDGTRARRPHLFFVNSNWKRSKTA